ncbi:LOW QUALITY PROTEIN: hypothetical protein JCM24511_08884 [Saitozyma sp. JCM 24511]|nr:LOW QUALITY PROTEIN: hypothetical protein JCM24511_08884 [Saitozyma sp. JCM 24511]
MPTPVKRALDAIQGPKSAKQARDDDGGYEEATADLPVFRLPKKRRLTAKLARKDTDRKLRTRTFVPRVGQGERFRDFGSRLPTFKRIPSGSGDAGARGGQRQEVREEEVVAKYPDHVKKPITSATRPINGPLPESPPAGAVLVPAGERELRDRSRSQADDLKLSWEIHSGDMKFLILKLEGWVASGMAGSPKQFLLELREAAIFFSSGV